MDRPDTSISSAERELRIGRLLNDFLDRRARGEPVSEASLLAANPSLASELRAHLGLLTELGPDHKRVEDLIGRGILARSPDPHYAASLGPYGVLRCIGRGGMGLVLQAHDTSLGRTIALKILRPDLAGEPAALTRFEREAKAAAALQHPNIVTVHAIGREHGVPYIVMEYIAGPSLADIIRGQAGTAAHEQPVRRTALDPALTRHVFEQLLSALDAAHGAGLIHRDVKSSNILLDWRAAPHTPAPLEPSNPRPLGPLAPQPLAPSPPRPLGPSVPRPLPLIKLADFGLARMRSSQTQVTVDGSVLGTPEYMSPEQARGEEVDHRTDLYSAGVVLYEMLTGQTPFKADTPTATIQRILNEPPRDPRKLTTDADPVLASIALKLMAKDPAQRFNSAAEITQALTANRRVRAPVNRRVLRRRWLNTSAAAILTLAVLTLAGWLSGWPADTRSIAAIELRDNKDGTSYVVARYADDPTWKVLRTVVGAITSATLVDVDGSGEKVVAVGLRAPDDDGAFFVYDERGERLWHLDLSGERQWPDCSMPRRWSCPALVAGNLDRAPGDEIVLGAGDPAEYPARISIIDARQRTFQATLWHYGGISRLHLEPLFFDGDRPAIVAAAVNNKLDGFEDPALHFGASELYTRYDKVPVLMILDPLHISGTGPPPEAADVAAFTGLHAYAFLDLPCDSAPYVPADGAAPVAPDPREITTVIAIESATEYSPEDGTGPWLKISLQRTKPTNWGGGTLIVDRNLAFRQFLPTVDETLGQDQEYWRKRWRVLVHDSSYVDADVSRLGP